MGSGDIVGVCYDGGMYQVLTVAAFLLFVWLPVEAHQVSLSATESRFDIIALPANIETSQVHLGSLQGFPVMYEVTLDATSTISAVLRQEYQGETETIPFGLMIVRQSDRGNVYEIARFNPTPADWTKTKKSDLGLVLQSSQQISEEVGPGLYRIEVSTPNNQGLYMLELGAGEISDGYFMALSHARTIQSFYGYSVFKLFTSSLVYYPLGIMLLLLAIQRTWAYRQKITNVS